MDRRTAPAPRLSTGTGLRAEYRLARRGFWWAAPRTGYFFVAYDCEGPTSQARILPERVMVTPEPHSMVSCTQSTPAATWRLKVAVMGCSSESTSVEPMIGWQSTGEAGNWGESACDDVGHGDDVGSRRNPREHAPGRGLPVCATGRRRTWSTHTSASRVGAAEHHRERTDNCEHDHDEDDRQDATGTPSGKATTIGAAVLFERDEQMPLMRNPEIPKKTSSPMNPDSPAQPSTAVERAAVERAAEPPSVFAHGLHCGEPNTRAPAAHPSQHDQRQALGRADNHIDAQRAVESTQRARAIPGQA